MISLFVLGTMAADVPNEQAEASSLETGPTVQAHVRSGPAPETPGLGNAPTGAGRDTPTREDETWTVLAYLNGDSDLEGYMLEDMNEMEMVGSSPRVDIIVQLDRIGGYDSSNGNWNDTRRYRVLRDEDRDILNSQLLDGSLGELEMSDPAVLKDFLEWGFENYPADRYMVVLGGHANGVVGGLCADDTCHEKMSLEGFGGAFRDAVWGSLGAPIDIISFDVCWLGMVEAAVEVMDHADYMVGAFDETPAEGWRYDLALPLILNSSKEMDERLEDVVISFSQEYDLVNENRYASLAAVDLSSFSSELLPLLTDLSQELFYTIDEQSIPLEEARSISDATRKKDYFRDLYHLATSIKGSPDMGQRTVHYAAEMVDIWDDVVIHSVVGAIHSPLSSGFGIYLPGPGDYYDPRYGDNRMSSLTAWDDLLVRFTSGIDLKPRAVNWTAVAPTEVHFLLTSKDSDSVTSVIVDTDVNGNADQVTLVREGGRYEGTFPLTGPDPVGYRYRVDTIWGNSIFFPPDGFSTVRFGSDTSPPEVWHQAKEVYNPSSSGLGLSFLISDDTGADLQNTRLEYWQDENLTPYSIPLQFRDMDPFTGWIEASAVPLDLETDTYFRYRLRAVDILGNQRMYPLEGSYSSLVGASRAFYLDNERSDVSRYDLLVDLWEKAGNPVVERTGELTLEVLSEYKAYVILEPRLPLTAEEAEVVLDYNRQGGEVLMVVDPKDRYQVACVSAVLGGWSSEATAEGNVGALFVKNPSAEIPGPLPWTAGPWEGSFTVPENGSAVYYTQPPLAGMLTNTLGKGRAVLGVPGLLDDSVMHREDNRQLSLLVLQYLVQNVVPYVSVDWEPPGGVLETGIPVHFDLSDSFDPDGDVVSYSMYADDGTFAEGSNPFFQHTFEESGLYTVRFTVTDAEGATSERTISLRMDRPPEMDIGVSSKSARVGDEVVFHYMGRDPDGDDITLIWDFGDGRIISGGEIVSHAYRLKGSFRMRLTATDDHGLSGSITEDIVILNSDPVAVIDREAVLVNGGEPDFTGPSRITLQVLEGDLVFMSGTLSSDPDPEDAVHMNWTFEDGAAITVQGPMMEYAFNTSGLKMVNLSVNDGSGGEDHDEIMVHVINRPPSCSYSVEELEDNRIRFTAHGEDDEWDMDGLVYSWDFGDGNTKRTKESVVIHHYRLGGTYGVRLKVIDGDGDEGVCEREVDVSGMGVLEVALVSLAAVVIIAAVALSFILYTKREMDRKESGLFGLFRRESGDDERPDRGLRRSRGPGRTVDGSKGSMGASEGKIGKREEKEGVGRDFTRPEPVESRPGRGIKGDASRGFSEAEGAPRGKRPFSPSGKRG